MTEEANINAFVVGDVKDVEKFETWMTRLGLAVRPVGKSKEDIMILQFRSVFMEQSRQLRHPEHDLVVMQLRKNKWPGEKSGEEKLTALEVDIARTLAVNNAPYQLVGGRLQQGEHALDGRTGMSVGRGQWGGHGVFEDDYETYASIGIVDRTGESYASLYAWCPEAESWDAVRDGTTTVSSSGARQRKIEILQFLSRHKASN